MVCSECGINYVMLGGHSPGCSHYGGELDDYDEDYAHKSTLLVDAAGDRGEALSGGLLRVAMVENGLSADVIEKYMGIQEDAIHTGSWCGAYSMLQVLLEQDLLDMQKLQEYLNNASF